MPEKSKKLMIALPSVLTIIALVVAVYVTIYSSQADSNTKIDTVAANLKTHEAVAEMRNNLNDTEHIEFKQCITDNKALLDSTLDVITYKGWKDSVFQRNDSIYKEEQKVVNSAILEQLKEIKDEIKNGN